MKSFKEQRKISADEVLPSINSKAATIKELTESYCFPIRSCYDRYELNQFNSPPPWINPNETYKTFLLEVLEPTLPSKWYLRLRKAIAFIIFIFMNTILYIHILLSIVVI